MNVIKELRKERENVLKVGVDKMFKCHVFNEEKNTWELKEMVGSDALKYIDKRINELQKKEASLKNMQRTRRDALNKLLELESIRVDLAKIENRKMQVMDIGVGAKEIRIRALLKNNKVKFGYLYAAGMMLCLLNAAQLVKLEEIINKNFPVDTEELKTTKILIRDLTVEAEDEKDDVIPEVVLELLDIINSKEG